jgi:hypothetical protein
MQAAGAINSHQIQVATSGLGIAYNGQQFGQLPSDWTIGAGA